MLRYLLLLLTTLPLAAFEEKPWLGDFFTFYLDTTYSYSHFSHVQNARSSLLHPWNVNLVTMDLAFLPTETLEVATELELVQTPEQAFGRRSAGLQGRIRWLDDIVGDPISFTTGLSLRQVAAVSLRDISCPYAASWDLELHAAVGHEYSCGPYWTSRWFALAAVGQGTSGAPWTRACAAFEANYQNRHQLAFDAASTWGFGPHTAVPIDHFRGWSHLAHISLDAGFTYRYLFPRYGHLYLNYAFRPYAHSYPQFVNTVQLGYHFPFSIF